MLIADQDDGAGDRDQKHRGRRGRGRRRRGRAAPLRRPGPHRPSRRPGRRPSSCSSSRSIRRRIGLRGAGQDLVADAGVAEGGHHRRRRRRRRRRAPAPAGPPRSSARQRPCPPSAPAAAVPPARHRVAGWPILPAGASAHSPCRQPIESPDGCGKPFPVCCVTSITQDWLAGQSRRYAGPTINRGRGNGVDAAREGDQMSVAEQNLTDRITYTDLYRRWEKSNWSAMDLDFTQDKQGWDDALRDPAQVGAVDLLDVLLRRGLASPTTSPPTSTRRRRRSRSTSSPTQQVDEARHAIFFHRFFSEVIGAGDDVAATLAFTEQHLGWGYRRSSTGSTRWPTSCAATARCRSSRRRSRSTTWSSRRRMAQPGQHFIEDFFVREGSMPGFTRRAWRTSPATSSATSASASRC